MKQIYRAANPVDAQLVVDLLAAEGIAAFTQGQYLSGAVGELPAGELLRVWVADEAVDRAQGLIAGRESQAPLLDDAMDPALAHSWSRAWSEPQRRYHTLRHLGDCLALKRVAQPGPSRRWRQRVSRRTFANGCTR